MSFENSGIALNVHRPVRSIIRSDGRAKVYGWTVDGKTAVVTMEKDGRGNYDVTEIKIAGKIIFFK